MSSKAGHGWIGVDLDGTLAQYEGWQGADHVGEPVPAMLARVKAWLNDGWEVRIFTARVSAPCRPVGHIVPADVRDAVARVNNAETARRAINAWCEKHFGHRLPITCAKDYGMVELWDDRAVQVTPNTGEPVGLSTRGLI